MESAGGVGQNEEDGGVAPAAHGAPAELDGQAGLADAAEALDGLDGRGSAAEKEPFEILIPPAEQAADGAEGEVVDYRFLIVLARLVRRFGRRAS